jgi:hypothetical protein
MVKTKLQHVGLGRNQELEIEEVRLNLLHYNDSLQKAYHDLERLKKTLARQTNPDEKAYYKNEIKETRKFLQIYRKRIIQERGRLHRMVL